MYRRNDTMLSALRVLLAFWLVAMACCAPQAQAACPEAVIGSSVPVVYQDCIEFIATSPGDPDSSNINTSANTQQGDYQVLVVVRKSSSNSAVITTPAGWSDIQASTRNSTAGGQNDLVMGVYGRMATTAGAENVVVASVAGNSSNDLVMWVMRFSNTNGAGVRSTNAPTATPTVTSPSVTTTSVNNLILRVAGIDDDDQNNATDSNVFGAPRIAITLQESEASTTSVTTVGAYNIQALAGASGTASFNNSSSEEWIAHTVALMPQAYFTLTHAASVQACSLTTISIAARNIDGSINTAYTGTLQLSTSTAHGYWTTTGGDAGGTLVTANNGDGTASYTFAASDNGTVNLVFHNPNLGSLNFNLLDSSSGYRELRTVSNDSNMAFTACGATSYFRVGHAGTGGVCGGAAITITAATGMGATQTGYTGTVTLSGNGSGDWSAGPTAAGTFNNGAAGDGVATYTFAAADRGQVVLYFTPANSTAVNFNVVDSTNPGRIVSPFFDPTLSWENCEYRITHDGSGNTCSFDNVQIAVVTASGAPVRYTGSITLSTSTSASDQGTWTLVSGGGAFADAAARDGLATYIFAGADLGVATFGFNTSSSGAVNFNVSGGGIATTVDPDIAIAACHFTVSYTGGASADVCTRQEVIITAVDNAGNVVQNFTGLVTLSTTSGHGTWAESGVQPGSLSDPFADDGAATYTFIAADGGSVALLLSTPVAETLRVQVETQDGAMEADPANNPDLVVGLCTFRISMSSTTMTSCTATTVTIAVYDSNNTLATGYTGTVNLSTSTNQGSWLAASAAGVFTPASTSNGSIAYTFVTGDAGDASFVLEGQPVGVLNVDVIAERESRFSDSSSFDPDIDVTPCYPQMLSSQCYRSQNQADAVTLPSRALASGSRMVLMYIATQSSTAATTPGNARLSNAGGTYNMTLIRQESNATSPGIRLQVWGITDANLPAGGGAVNAAFNGAYTSGVNDPSMCLVVLQGVEQVFPAAAVPASNGQLNSSDGTGAASSTLNITTIKNSSLVLNSLATATTFVFLSSSQQTTRLWHVGPSSPGPASALFFGASHVQSVPATVAADVSAVPAFSMSPFAHIAMALAPISPNEPFAPDHVPVTLFKTFSGNVSYRAIGASLRTQNNQNDACAMGSSASQTLNLPGGSTIRNAYLYWSASGGTHDIDRTVSFGPTGSQVTLEADDVFQILNASSAGTDFFIGFKDVTSLVPANTSQSYTLSGLSAQTGFPWLLNQTCLGGWGLVVVYDNAVTNRFINVINLFHGFQPFQDSSFMLVPRNFRMAAPSVANGTPHGQLTHLTFEGDESLSDAAEVFQLQNDPATLTFDTLVNIGNPPTNQYNDTITFPNYGTTTPYRFNGTYTLQSSTSYGVDVDTYYVAGPVATAADPKEDVLFPFGNQAAEQITTRYSSGQDLVMLAGEFISVTSSDIADLEMFVTTDGAFKVNSDATGSLLFNIVNNGDGATSSGYATGTVILTARMPAGVTIDSVLPADNHWSCSNDLNAFTCTFNIENWPGGSLDSGAGVRRLPEFASLPQVRVRVDIGNTTAFPLLSNVSQITGRIARFDSEPTMAACITSVPLGYQPAPTNANCQKAREFDNVNDLNQDTIDIDDLNQKQANNNNVDRAIFLIGGLRTDLAVNIDAVTVLQQGQPARYQLTLTNNGPDATSEAVTATVNFPAGVTPVNPGTVAGWTCNTVSLTVTCTRASALPRGASNFIGITTTAVTATQGSFVSTTAVVSGGPHNFDAPTTNNSSTDVSQVVGNVASSNDRLLISASEAASLGSNALGFDDEDLVIYDPVADISRMFMDTSSLGNTALGDIDAVHVLPNGWIVLSADDASTLLGVSFADEDLVLYDPILQVARVIFTGADTNKFGGGAGNADIDALHVNYNDSWDPQDWDMLMSTAEASVLNGTALDDNDFALYDMSSGVVTVLFNGADANKFNGGTGDVGGLYVRYDDADNYVLAIDDATATIDTDHVFTRDDLVEWNGSAANTMRTTTVFTGDTAPGIFTPVSASRRLDAVHVVEEGYYGHFAISALDGTTCQLGRVTIRWHAGLTHDVEPGYLGSIRIVSSSPTSSWLPDASSHGTLVDLGNGVARYTFHPADNGSVMLGLAEDAEVSNIDVDVTNGIATDREGEDPLIDITASNVGVSYADHFGVVSYNNNESAASGTFSSNWVEQNDDGSVNAGNIRIDGGKLRLRDNNPAVAPAIYRAINFNYEASEAVLLSFRWGRSNGTTSDQFVVEWSQNNGLGWNRVGDNYGAAANGAIAESTVVLNLTAAGVVANEGQQLWIRFRAASGLQLDTASIDNVEINTATTTSCGSADGVDHYHIASVGTGISCLAENVTFTAHDAGHNVVAPGAGVVLNISTSTNKGSWTALPGSSLLSSPVSDNGVAAYTFQNAQTSVTIPFNYTAPTTDPEVVNFNVVDSGMVRELEEGNLSVATAGLRFYNDTTGSPQWPGQVAGMDSLLFTGQELVVMAIKASDSNPAVCEPLFSDGAVLPVQLLFECTDAATCASPATQLAVTNNGVTTAVNTTDSNGTLWIAAAAETEFTTVNLLFEDFSNGDFGSGTYNGARLRLNYGDVGQLQIHGRYRIPFNESAVGAFGLSNGYMRGSGRTFPVRPFALDVDFAEDRRNDFNNSLALDHNGPAFGKAGVPINVGVKAVTWQAADDQNNDGMPDFEADLSNNTVTPNFGREAGSSWRIGLDVITDNPAVAGVNDNPGVPGGIAGTLVQSDDAFMFFNGTSTSANTITFDEVGIFDVSAVLLDNAGVPASYLGFQPVFGGVANVGRITPDHYDLDAGGSFITERPNAGGLAPFTYMGEEFEVSLALLAEHADGSVLQNYFGNFATLSDFGDASVQFVFKSFMDIDNPPMAATDDVDHSARLERVAGSFSFTSPWTAGEASITGRLRFNKQEITTHPQTQQEAPLVDMTIAVDLDDGDDVHDEADVGDDDGTNETSDYTWHYIAKNEWRYGRLRLENAYGSELREENELSGKDVAMRLVTEYWDGSRFVVNSDDNGTAFDIAHLYPVAPPRYPALNSFEGNLNAGEFSNTPGISTVRAGLTLEQGATDMPFFFTAPGEGNDGAVVMEYDLEEAGLEFLRYKWRSADQIVDVFTTDDSEYDDDPRSLLEFGRYQGNERIINWQELFCQEPAPCEP